MSASVVRLGLVVVILVLAGLAAPVGPAWGADPESQLNQMRVKWIDKKVAVELAKLVLAAARPRSSDSGKVLDYKATIDEQKKTCAYWAHMEFIGYDSGKRRECKLTVECDTSKKGAWVVTAIRYDDDTGLNTPEKALEELREKLNAK